MEPCFLKQEIPKILQRGSNAYYINTPQNKCNVRARNCSQRATRFPYPARPRSLSSEATASGSLKRAGKVPHSRLSLEGAGRKILYCRKPRRTLQAGSEEFPGMDLRCCGAGG